MKFKQFSIFIIGSVLLAACNGGSEQYSQRMELVQTVLNVHDTVMVDTDRLIYFQTKLEEKKTVLLKDSLNNLDNLRELDVVLLELEVADEKMFDWMNQFRIPKQDDPRSHEEIMQYLNDQLAKIQEVEVLTDNSMANAQKLIGTKKD